MNKLFCFGLGYSAAALARRVTARGWTVSGTSTDAEKANALTRQGYSAFIFDGRARNAEVAEALRSATHVLLSIPPDASGDPAFTHYRDDIASSPSISWIGYFSSVSVYGDADGGWVDETTTPHPRTERGARRLKAENDWLGLGRQTGKAVVIFRLPGIYGPGRSAIDQLRAGTARRIFKPGQVTNRVHVDDIAAAVDAALHIQHRRPRLQRDRRSARPAAGRHRLRRRAVGGTVPSSYRSGRCRPVADGSELLRAKARKFRTRG